MGGFQPPPRMQGLIQFVLYQVCVCVWERERERERERDRGIEKKKGEGVFRLCKYIYYYTISQEKLQTKSITMSYKFSFYLRPSSLPPPYLWYWVQPNLLTPPPPPSPLKKNKKQTTAQPYRAGR